jgi:hypothetical protein
MAVKAQWSFDHLPTGMSAGSYIGNLGLGTGATFGYGSDSGGSSAGSFTIQNGWLSFGYAYSAYYSGGTSYGTNLTTPLNNLFDNTKPHSVIGFRLNLSGAAALSSPGCVWLTTGSTVTKLVTQNDASLGLVQGGIYYIELVFDRINNAISTFVNNQFKKTVFFDFTTITAATTISFGCYYTGGNTNITCLMRDFYFIDDTQDSTPCTRQGPGTARPMALVAVTAPNWTSSDGNTPLADLTTPISTSMVATPTITGPTTQTPITAQFQTAAPSNLKVLAASVLVSSSNASAGNGVLDGAWSLNGQTEQVGTTNYPNTSMQWSQALLSTQDPSGNPWTVSSIQAAQFSATPNGS